MDKVSEDRLTLIHPVLAAKTRAMADDLEAQGITIRVVQGLRTKEEQDALYAQGRNGDTRKKVTNAKGGSSHHNFGLAVDCVPGIRGGSTWHPNWDAWYPNWDAKHPDYHAMILAGEAQGLASGSRWITMPDEPHFQLGNIPTSPTDVMRDTLASGGIPAVWSMFT